MQLGPTDHYKGTRLTPPRKRRVSGGKGRIGRGAKGSNPGWQKSLTAPLPSPGCHVGSSSATENGTGGQAGTPQPHPPPGSVTFITAGATFFSAKAAGKKERPNLLSGRGQKSQSKQQVVMARILFTRTDDTKPEWNEELYKKRPLKIKRQAAAYSREAAKFTSVNLSN